MSSKFDQIRSWTAELAALEPLEKSFTYLRTIQDVSMTCWLSGERLLPFGLLVWLSRAKNYNILEFAIFHLIRYEYQNALISFPFTLFDQCHWCL